MKDWNNNITGWIVEFRGEAEGAMGMVLMELRNEWAIQCLVLFSFALQVLLLSLAGIRRHNVSFWPRAVLWLAYQLADSTALFTLGHLSISSKLPEHHLVAFWAPFLLVHLGGQDTVTAYSFEDNQLWLRHLQTLVLQVMAAAYVLYKYMPSSESLIVAAAMLIFVVGVLKYGERIMALRSASFDRIWASLDKSGATSTGDGDGESSWLFQELLQNRFNLELDTEAVLMGAHGLLDVCKGLFIGARRGRHHYVRDVLESFQMYDRLDKLMEMELSLMYDILYTKAGVIHTWYGYSIRVISLVATVAAFSLFQLSDKRGHSSKDVGITYVLLVGAMLLEMTSVARAAGSTWASASLYHRKWYRFHGELLALRSLTNAAGRRRWSGSIGQYNLLESRAREPPLCVKIASLLGPRLELMAEDWLDEWRHWRSAQLSASTKELVLREILEMGNRGEEIGSLPGLLTLRRFGLDKSVGWSVQDIGFEDSIVAWHVASHICVFNDDRGNDVKADVMDAITVLSNYMMFLLALRPYMLPGPVRRSRYIHLRGACHGVMQGSASPDNSKEGRLAWALRTGLHARVCSFHPTEDYDAGVRLADVLYHYHRHDSLDVIFGVWVEMLCYVADHCSRESHARQLSCGGELVTIVWLMARHANLS